MKHDEYDNLLALASRNAMIITWLRKLNGHMLNAMRRAYAAHLGCHIDEIPEYDLDEVMNGPDELAWLWTHYEGPIRANDYLGS